MRKINYILLFFIVLSSTILSKTYQATIVQTLNGLGGLDVTLYLAHTSGTSPILGDASFYINFNSGALSSPNLIDNGQWSSPRSGYDMSHLNIGTGVVSIEIVRNGTPTYQIPDVNTSLGTIRFTITDSSKNSLISWNNSLIVVYDVNDNIIDTSGNFVDPGVFPLPVELSYFSALINSNNVSLSWKTATEVNNNGFEIERKADSRNSSWVRLGFVQGHGNSNSPKEYSFTDKNLTGGTKFAYRLKQIDNDGKYQYSKEVEVEVIPLTYELSQNYPNPFNPVTEIKYNLPEASRVVLKVYNIIGQQVASLVNGNIDAGFHSVMFDGSNLPSGTYIYRLQTNNFVQVKKMVLLK